jgi:hypothetical protein
MVSKARWRRQGWSRLERLGKDRKLFKIRQGWAMLRKASLGCVRLG